MWFLSLTYSFLVSRVWRQLAEDPLLWRRFVLVVDSNTDFVILDTINRFSRVQSLIVRGVGEQKVEEIWRLLGCRNIETVFCTKLDFLRLAGQLNFLRKVTNLKHFIVTGSVSYHIEDKVDEAVKIRNLLKTIANSVEDGNCKLKSLSLDTHLYNVESLVMTKVVESLERLDLSSCDLGNNDANAFVDAILKSDTLKRLVLNKSYKNTHVDPRKLARAVHKLEFVNLVVHNENQFRELWKIYTGRMNTTN